MARDSKLQVAAINIRIPGNRTRDYAALLERLAKLKKAVRVFGDTAVAIQWFDAKSGLGAFSKFTEINIDGDWFDIDEFEEAKPEIVGEIQIPKNLRPNYSAFYFQLDSDLHVVAFETYSLSKSLSTRAVRIYFDQACLNANIVEQFGRIQIDIVSDFEDAERLLNLPDIREIDFVIRRPNADDIGEALAAAIEERLAEQNADEYRETIKSSGHGGGIKPNARSKRLGAIAAENGVMRVTNLTNGVITPHSTEPAPLSEGTKYKQGLNDVRDLFIDLAKKIFATIKSARQANV